MVEASVEKLSRCSRGLKKEKRLRLHLKDSMRTSRVLLHDRCLKVSELTSELESKSLVQTIEET